jgi:hypothetical protein
MLSKDPALQLAFSMYESRGVYALLLGSGLSRAADIPTGWEITIDLIRRVAKANGVPEQADWASWYRTNYQKEPSYSDLLEDLAGSPAERRAILHSYIDPTADDRANGRKVPTAAHRAIAQLVAGGYVRVIITTNFDALTESALREIGIEPTIIASVDALRGAEPLTHSRCYLLKVHGDYKDARILNTESELSAYPPEYNTLLDRIFDEYGLVVCGWSGEWDDALRSAILRAPNRRYSTFWAIRGTAGPRAEELIRHRAARLINITGADQFFSRLASQIQTLADSQRENPLSVELLVAQTKRFVLHPESRIQLEATIADEAERVASLLQEAHFDFSAAISSESFRERIARYESAVEGLASIAGVLGRWGSGAEFRLVMDVLNTLRQHSDVSNGGLTVWLDLRRYPGALVFTGYLLGMIRSERWSDVHRLLSAEVHLQATGKMHRLVEVFFHETLGDDHFWRNAEGQENKITPAANHVFNIFRAWHVRFAPLTPDYERLFDVAEVLCSITLGDQYSAGEVASALNNDQASIWMPVGRVHVRAGRMVEALQKKEWAEALLKAGIAAGDPNKFNNLVKYFAQSARRMQFGRR